MESNKVPNRNVLSTYLENRGLQFEKLLILRSEQVDLEYYQDLLVSRTLPASLHQSLYGLKYTLMSKGFLYYQVLLTPKCSIRQTIFGRINHV